jgi:hypothetical protein
VLCIAAAELHLAMSMLCGNCIAAAGMLDSMPLSYHTMLLCLVTLPLNMLLLMLCALDFFCPTDAGVL